MEQRFVICLPRIQMAAIDIAGHPEANSLCLEYSKNYNRTYKYIEMYFLFQTPEYNTTLNSYSALRAIIGIIYRVMTCAEEQQRPFCFAWFILKKLMQINIGGIEK